MSTKEVGEEALLNIRCTVKGYNLCRFEVNIGELFTANKKSGIAEARLKLLLTIVDSLATYNPSLWTLFGHYMQISLLSETFSLKL